MEIDLSDPPGRSGAWIELAEEAERYRQGPRSSLYPPWTAHMQNGGQGQRSFHNVNGAAHLSNLPRTLQPGSTSNNNNDNNNYTAPPGQIDLVRAQMELDARYGALECAEAEEAAISQRVRDLDAAIDAAIARFEGGRDAAVRTRDRLAAAAEDLRQTIDFLRYEAHETFARTITSRDRDPSP